MYSHTDALKSFFNFVSSIQKMVDRVNEQWTTATTTGLQSYNLGEFRYAKNFLLIAATTGNRDVQYALAEVIRQGAGWVTEEAKGWYQQAADQNHVYALMRLGDEVSLKKARILADANTDRAEGMLQIYELTKDIEWLRKSAAAGSAEAKYILAYQYSSDEKLIPDSTERDTQITNLLKQASVAGLPKAMSWYSNRPSVQNDLPTRRQWVEKRAELNDVNGLVDYAYALTHMSADDDGVDRAYGFEKDVVKAYALLWLVVETTRDFKRHAEISRNLIALEKDLTAADVVKAKELAQQWKMSHPPMSEYRLTYNDAL